MFEFERMSEEDNLVTNTTTTTASPPYEGEEDEMKTNTTSTTALPPDESEISLSDSSPGMFTPISRKEVADEIFQKYNENAARGTAASLCFKIIQGIEKLLAEKTNIDAFRKRKVSDTALKAYQGAIQGFKMWEIASSLISGKVTAKLLANLALLVEKSFPGKPISFLINWVVDKTGIKSNKDKPLDYEAFIREVSTLGELGVIQAAFLIDPSLGATFFTIYLNNHWNEIQPYLEHGIYADTELMRIFRLLPPVANYIRAREEYLEEQRKIEEERRNKKQERQLESYNALKEYKKQRKKDFHESEESFEEPPRQKRREEVESDYVPEVKDDSEAMKRRMEVVRSYRRKNRRKRKEI